MKVKRGIAIEITQHLTSVTAPVIAQWIGGYTVISNQKTFASQENYKNWIASGADEANRPAVNTQAAYLTDELPFLKGIPAQLRRNAGAKWFEAFNAAKTGIRKHPAIKGKHKKRNCYVTNELFRVEALDKDRCVIHVLPSAKKQDAGRPLFGVTLPFSAEAAGKSLFLSRRGTRFWLSIAYDVKLDVADEATVKDKLKQLTAEQLTAVAVGYDLGVKRQVTGSNGAVHHLQDLDSASLDRLELRKKRYQRRYARMARANDKRAGTNKRKRTNGEKKLKDKIARYDRKKANIKFNSSHIISKAIATETPLVAVFEDIKINNMVRAPKAKICKETGKWLANGRAAKRGLNRVIHGANMGQIRDMTAYKLAGAGKLMIKVRAQYSSQECSACSHTAKENRKTQSAFECVACGHKENADENAAKVIKQRGITHILHSESFSQEKTVRKASVRRKKAQEMASSGDGDQVSPDANLAMVVDALNSEGSVPSHGSGMPQPS
jgi:putative transposase